LWSKRLQTTILKGELNAFKRCIKIFNLMNANKSKWWSDEDFGPENNVSI